MCEWREKDGMIIDDKETDNSWKWDSWTEQGVISERFVKR